MINISFIVTGQRMSRIMDISCVIIRNNTVESVEKDSFIKQYTPETLKHNNLLISATINLPLFAQLFPSIVTMEIYSLRSVENALIVDPECKIFFTKCVFILS